MSVEDVIGMETHDDIAKVLDDSYSEVRILNPNWTVEIETGEEILMDDTLSDMRRDIVILPADDPKQPNIGWYMMENGMLTPTNPILVEEEIALYNYRNMMENYKIEKLKQNIPNYSIGWLEI